MVEKYSPSLYKDCRDGEKKQERTTIIVSGHNLMLVLRDMLETKSAAVLEKSLSKSNYEKAAWPYEQADTVGELRGLKYLLDILPKT